MAVYKSWTNTLKKIDVYPKESIFSKFKLKDIEVAN